MSLKVNRLDVEGEREMCLGLCWCWLLSFCEDGVVLVGLRNRFLGKKEELGYVGGWGGVVW